MKFKKNYCSVSSLQMSVKPIYLILKKSLVSESEINISILYFMKLLKHTNLILKKSLTLKKDSVSMLLYGLVFIYNEKEEI